MRPQALRCTHREVLQARYRAYPHQHRERECPADTAVVLLAFFPVTVLALNLIQRQHYDAIRGLMALVLRRSIRTGLAGPALLTIATAAAFASGISIPTPMARQPPRDPGQHPVQAPPAQQPARRV